MVGGVTLGTFVAWFFWGRERQALVRENTEMRTRLTSMDFDRQRLIGELESAHAQVEHMANARVPATPPPTTDMMVVLEELEMDESLQAIKGVGPKLALLLAAEGINNLSRLANMSDGALQHLAIRLPTIAERLRREGWREQAREILDSRAQSKQVANHAGGRPPKDLTIDLKEPDAAVAPEL